MRSSVSCVRSYESRLIFFFFFQAEDGIRDKLVTGVQTCALPISPFRAIFQRQLDAGKSHGTERLRRAAEVSDSAWARRRENAKQDRMKRSTRFSTIPSGVRTVKRLSPYRRAFHRGVRLRGNPTKQREPCSLTS